MGGGLSKKQKAAASSAAGAGGGAAAGLPPAYNSDASARPPPYSPSASGGALPPPSNPNASAAPPGGYSRMAGSSNQAATRQPSGAGHRPGPPTAPPPPQYPGFAIDGEEEEEEEMYSDLPPTMITFSLDKASGLPPPGPSEVSASTSSSSSYYCVIVIGCVTRVFEAVACEGATATFYCPGVNTFPLHQRKEIDIIGLSMHCTVFRQGVGAECDEAVGECTVELERQWLFSRQGHAGSHALQTLDGRETRTSITFSLQPEFGMGMVAPQGTEEAEGGAARRTLHMSPVRKVQLEGDELFAQQIMEEERRREAERQKALQQALSGAGPSPSPVPRMSLPPNSGYLDISESTPRVGATPRGAKRGLITSSQLDAYVGALRASNRSSDRKMIVQEATSLHAFSSGQCQTLLASLKYQHEVVEACKLLIKHITDPHNSHTLLQAVEAPLDRSKVAEYMFKVQSEKAERIRRQQERASAAVAARLAGMP